MGISPVFRCEKKFTFHCYPQRNFFFKLNSRVLNFSLPTSCDEFFLCTRISKAGHVSFTLDSFEKMTTSVISKKKKKKRKEKHQLYSSWNWKFRKKEFEKMLPAGEKKGVNFYLTGACNRGGYVPSWWVERLENTASALKSLAEQPLWIAPHELLLANVNAIFGLRLRSEKSSDRAFGGRDDKTRREGWRGQRGGK